MFLLNAPHLTPSSICGFSKETEQAIHDPRCRLPISGLSRPQSFNSKVHIFHLHLIFKETFSDSKVAVWKALNLFLWIPQSVVHQPGGLVLMENCASRRTSKISGIVPAEICQYWESYPRTLGSRSITYSSMVSQSRAYPSQ